MAKLVLQRQKTSLSDHEGGIWNMISGNDDFDFGPGFLGFKQANIREIESRQNFDYSKMPVYPVRFLNDLCYGILPSEVVVVGAASGIGKTQFANDLAIENSKNGKKVYLFSLEGHKDEVISRLKYKYICSEYYKNPSGIEMSYPKFLMNKISDIDQYEEGFKNYMKSVQGNLFLYDRKDTLSSDLLIEKIGKINQADLIILDHLHYLSLEDSFENSQLTQVMRTIKDISELRGIPFVIISHLRKKTKDRDILPDNDDFHGTSNITKIASTCITISPWYPFDNEKEDISATLFRVTKSRSGAQKKYIGQVGYNRKLNKYSNSYKVCKIEKGDLVQMDYENYPSWARITL